MLRFALPLLVALLIPVSGMCAIYGYVDDEGVYHMTNIRPPGKSSYRTLIEDRDSGRRSASIRVLE